VAIPLWKAAPSLAFGNATVLKPSEESSAVALLLAGIILVGPARDFCTETRTVTIVP
jgi:acyl-CoA reductase-like NAD-dependent aldehyde dehydrogenase